MGQARRLKDIFAALAAEADNEYAMIDPTIVRAHPHSAGALKKGTIKPSASAQHKDLYQARHLIENFFAKLKQFRAIATRYDGTAKNVLAAIYFAPVFIWLVG